MVAVDDLFEIAREVPVERHGRPVGFRQRDRFREQTAWMWLHMQIGRCPGATASSYWTMSDGGKSVRPTQVLASLFQNGRTSHCWTSPDKFLSVKNKKQLQPKSI